MVSQWFPVSCQGMDGMERMSWERREGIVTPIVEYACLGARFR